MSDPRNENHPLSKAKIEGTIIVRNFERAKRALEESQKALEEAQRSFEEARQKYDALDPYIKLEVDDFDPDPIIKLGGYDKIALIGRILKPCGCVVGYSQEWRCKKHKHDFVQKRN